VKDTIDIVINGQARTVSQGVTLLELLAGLALDPRTGDAIELVHFVGGG